MNAKPNIRELDRIRTDIGSALRTFADPAPQSLIALLRNLEACVRDAELEKLFAEVDARVAELLCAAGGGRSRPRLKRPKMPPLTLDRVGVTS
jgi:hypothetical protein